VSEGNTTCGGDLVEGLSGSRFIYVKDVDCRSVLCKPGRNGAPNATAGARNDCNLAV